MKERPILFSAPMVRAILDGRKTMTRRVVKASRADFLRIDSPSGNYIDSRDGRTVYGWDGNVGAPLKHRFGQPGDRLWVRETWARVPSTAYRHSTGVQQSEDPTSDGMAAVYRAGWERSSPGCWRPSIHMPRWASRITLEVTSVRVERLQDITEADAIAEGLTRDGDGWRGAPELPWFASPIAAFRSLWESINGGGSWDENPFVWVVEFRRIEQEAKAA